MPVTKPTTRHDRDESTLRKVLIRKLRPNPFRRLKEYPILQDKVELLKESIETTGFWSNIVGRPASDGDGVELAYGHHRAEALRQLYGPAGIVQIVVKSLTNDDMLRMMARENMEEWRSDAWVEMETVRATIEAAARGEITLPAVGDRDPGDGQAWREVSVDGRKVRYRAIQIAKYLAWTSKANKGCLQPNDKCAVAFLLLDALRDGVIPSEDKIKGLSRQQAKLLVHEARATQQNNEAAAQQSRRWADEERQEAATSATPADRRDHEKKAQHHDEEANRLEQRAPKAARHVFETGAEELRKGSGREKVHEIAESQKKAIIPSPREMTWDGMAARLVGYIDAVPSSEIRAQLGDLIDNMRDLSEESVAAVQDASRRMINRWRRLIAEFDKAAAGARVATSRRNGPGGQPSRPALPGSPSPR
jgi:ParB-like chromosome segregation protein Spo0J